MDWHLLICQHYHHHHPSLPVLALFTLQVRPHPPPSGHISLDEIYMAWRAKCLFDHVEDVNSVPMYVCVPHYGKYTHKWCSVE